MAVKKDSMRR